MRLAQSASALGAGLLGFGIGAKWGEVFTGTTLISIIIVGAVFHIAGMYVNQMKDAHRAGLVAKTLWVSAWICLLVLVALFVYISVS